MIRSLLDNQEGQGLCAHLKTQLRPPATTAATGHLALGHLPLWVVFFPSDFFVFRNCPPSLLMDRTQSYFLMGL